MIHLIDGLGVGPQWFLSVLFIAEVIFFFINKIKNKRLMFAVIVAVLAIGLYVTPIYEVCRKAFVAVGFIGVGYYFRNYEPRGKESLIVVMIIGIICHILGVAFNGTVGLYGLAFGNSAILYFVLSAGTCLGIISLFMLIKRPLPVLTLFGKNSMILLCTHSYILEFLYQVSSKLLRISWFSGAVMTAVALLIEIPVIYGFKRWLPQAVGIWK